MKTVRFAALVDSAGRPETHLVFVKPEADTVLRKAIKAGRVVTVYHAGKTTDHGEVGFQPGPSRQYLIFPRSVAAFQGRRVVGIKYDLLESAAIPKGKQAVRPAPPSRKKAEKARKVTEEAIPADKVVKFPEPRKETAGEDDEESEAMEDLKSQVRKAMRELEKGKAVAAFNLLKRIVGD